MKKQIKERNSYVNAMNDRHPADTKMKDRREKRKGNPKRSWKNEEY
jgi:hypothetical protein